MTKLILLVVTSAIALFRDRTASASFVVDAGDFDRHNTIVEVRFKDGVPGGTSKIADILGPAHPLQMLDEHRGVFILPDLKAHETRTFDLQQRPVGQEKWPVSATAQGGKIIVDIGGHPVLTYQGDKTDPPAGYDPAYKRGGYLYPVLTPSGLNVTDDYPANHKHHHGIWSAWTKTEFEGRHPDFWNMGDKTGIVEPVDFGHEFWGPVCGGFTT